MSDVLRPNSTDARWYKILAWSVTQNHCYRSIALGNGSQFNIGAFFVGSNLLFVGVENHGASTFKGFVRWTYAAEKLGLMPGDAQNLADWINYQLCTNEEMDQGTYCANLCAREDA